MYDVNFSFPTWNHGTYILIKFRALHRHRSWNLNCGVVAIHSIGTIWLETLRWQLHASNMELLNYFQWPPTIFVNSDHLPLPITPYHFPDFESTNGFNLPPTISFYHFFQNNLPTIPLWKKSSPSTFLNGIALRSNHQKLVKRLDISYILLLIPHTQIYLLIFNVFQHIWYSRNAKFLKNDIL